MANRQPPHPNASSDSGPSPTGVSALLNKHQLSANRRMEIEGDPILKLHLQEWKEQLKEDQLKIETYRTRRLAAKAELYQHMSFYIPLQGVVFGAWWVGGKLTCETSFFPALFSFLTSIAIAVSVHFKLGYYEIEKLKFIIAEGRAQNLVNKINKLRSAGREFKFEDIDDSQISSQKKQDNEVEAHKWFYRAVMFFLFALSMIILASCIVIPCWILKRKN